MGGVRAAGAHHAAPARSQLRAHRDRRGARGDRQALPPAGAARRGGQRARGRSGDPLAGAAHGAQDPRVALVERPAQGGTRLDGGTGVAARSAFPRRRPFPAQRQDRRWTGGRHRRLPARRFLLGAGIAELLWAGYSVGVGYWGGLVLAGTLSGALVGLGASALLAGGAMGVQWAMRRRARRSAAAPADADADADASVDVPADPPTDASPDAYVDANAGAPVGAPAPASPNADAPVDAPAPAPPSADTDAPARAPVPAPVSVPVCVAARAAASVWVPAPARSAVPLRVPAPARRAAGEGPRSAPVRGAGRGPGVVTDGDAVGEGAGAPAAAPDSSAAAVPGSAGDPVTDGVGEPIGFSALHQIRRG